MATISQLLNFDVATIQGRPLIKGGFHCIETLSVQLLFNIVRSSLRSTMHVSVFNKVFSRAKV